MVSSLDFYCTMCHLEQNTIITSHPISLDYLSRPLPKITPLITFLQRKNRVQEVTVRFCSYRKIWQKWHFSKIYRWTHIVDDFLKFIIWREIQFNNCTLKVSDYSYAFGRSSIIGKSEFFDSPWFPHTNLAKITIYLNGPLNHITELRILEMIDSTAWQPVY